MGADALAQRLRGTIEPIAAGHDLVVEQADARTRGRSRTVTVVLDLADGPGSLGSDLLGEVTREISDALDVADVIDGAYTLEVSSPGTDRPLTEPRHFRRAQRRLVRITTAEGTTLTARVRSADDDGVTLRHEKTDGEDTTLPYDQIASAVVEVELRRAKEED